MTLTQSERGQSRTDAAAPVGVRGLFLRGSALLGTAYALQRVLSFVAISIAARVGGPAVLGAYSLALLTATMVASYCGLNIGVTSSRFVGEHPRNTLPYRRMLHILGSIAASAAVVAGLALALAAEPIARYALDDVTLTPLLRIAALTAVLIVAFEAVNGLLVGTFRFTSALWLAAVSGLIMVFGLGAAARVGATAMVLTHALALGCGLAIALLTAWPLVRPLAPVAGPAAPLPTVGRVVRFGGTQAVATVAIAAASWWVIVRITRHDSSLEQMGFYMVANQLKAIAAIGPNVVAQLVFPVLARMQDEPERQVRVIDGSTFVGVVAGVVLGGLTLLALPVVLHVYGTEFQGAAMVSILLVTMSAIQVCSVPLTHYLTTLDLRAVTAINVVWALLLGVGATVFVPRYGVAGAGIAWVIAALVWQLLVFAALAQRRQLPPTSAWLSTLGAVAMLALGALAVAQHAQPRHAAMAILLQAVILTVLAAFFWKHARTRGYLINLKPRH